MARPHIDYYALLLSRLWKFLLAYFALILIATGGFYLLEGGSYDLLTSLYWAVVTLGTVGYGDVHPTNSPAQIFTIGVILSEVFLGAYLISIIISVVTDITHKRAMGNLGTDFTGHVVVIGFGVMGRVAVRELLALGEKVAVVTDDPNLVPVIRSLGPESRVFAAYQPTGDPELFDQVNAARAKAVVVCTPDDTANLVIALGARTAAPALRVVVAVSRPELKPTLIVAGVTYVTAPSDMGGRLLANASFRPDVANAFENLTTASFGADIGEFVLTDHTPITTQPLPEAEAMVRRASDCLVVGYARRDDGEEYRTVLNPSSSFRFRPGDAILVLGSLENLHKLERWLGVAQGR